MWFMQMLTHVLRLGELTCECRSKNKGESIYKPGFVVNSHSSRIAITDDLKQPTRIQRGPRLMDPYLVLLQVGFA